MWASATHGASSWPDGIWLCYLSSFFAGSCPVAGPTITAGIAYPVFTKASIASSRLYVPNMLPTNNGTVTSYPEGGPYSSPYATFVNLAAPWDVGGVDD